MAGTKPISLNLARIVANLMTRQKGWRIDSLQTELNIQPRTYRKYRKLLTEEFEPFLRSDGSSIAEEVQDGEMRYLRLNDQDQKGLTDDDFVPHVVAVYFAQQLMSLLEGTDFSEAFETVLSNFTNSLEDRPFVMSHLLRNVDRIFFKVPDAPKDYSNHREMLRTLAHALIFTKVIETVYRSPTHGPIPMTLYPYSLMSYRSGLYLVAVSEKHDDDPRLYVVDRFEAIEETDRRFEYPSPARFNPETYTEGSFGIFRGDPRRKYVYEVIFANNNWLKMYVSERRWHPTQVIDELADGRLRMTFEVSARDEVDRWLRSFGQDVEIVKDGLEIG